MEATSLARHTGCPGTATFLCWKGVFGAIFEMQQKTHTSFRVLTFAIFHLGRTLKFSAAFKGTVWFSFAHMSAFLNKAASRFVEQILEILQMF